MSKIFISTAPGRICLFGDHQDYLNLPIIACAINRSIKIRAAENQSQILRIIQKDLNKTDEIDLTQNQPPANNGDFIRLALQVLRRYNCIPNKGFDVFISGDIPINAGLSSSSAFTIAWIQFLVYAFGVEGEIDAQLLAKLAYETEVEEQGSSGGKMDQYTIGFGELIYLDTLGDQLEKIEARPEGLIVGVSGVAKDTFGTLAALKENTWAAIHKAVELNPSFDIQTAGLKELNSVSPRLGEEHKILLEAAVKNHLITQQAKIAFQKDKIDRHLIGKLMTEHHELLRGYLKITVPKIDDMIAAALDAGALGAKIVGSGGGGCIVALADSEVSQAVVQAIKSAGAKDAFSVEIDKGASIEMTDS